MGIMLNTNLIQIVPIRIVCACVAIGFLTGCSLIPSDYSPLMVVSNEARMERCEYLGTATKVIQKASLLGHYSQYAAQQEVMTQGVRRGATHIVWLHASKDGAMALTYHCPDPLPDLSGKPQTEMSTVDPEPPASTAPGNPAFQGSASTDTPVDTPPPSPGHSPDSPQSTTPLNGELPTSW